MGHTKGKYETEGGKGRLSNAKGSTNKINVRLAFEGAGVRREPSPSLESNKTMNMYVDYRFAKSAADPHCQVCGGEGVVEMGSFGDEYDRYCINCVIPKMQDMEEDRAEAQFEAARGN